MQRFEQELEKTLSKEQVRKEIAEKENAKEAEYHSVVDDLDDFGV